MKEHRPSHHSPPSKWAFWLAGLGSLAWLLLRSGTNPRRLVYPCQRAALASSLGFLGYLASLSGIIHLYRRLRRKVTPAGVALLGLTLLLVPVLAGSAAPATPVHAQVILPAWTSPLAISNVFAVSDVPAPECSLDGGDLPDAPPCNDQAYALRDAGVDSLVSEMEARHDYFYETATHPTGVVGADDVVVVKVNNQWAGLGDGDGSGRLCTNTDLLKGLIWRVLQHPDGFSGEVVVAENTQDVAWSFDVTPANAQDQEQTYQDVVNAFQSLGYPVSLYRWDDLNSQYVSGGSVDGSGYPNGEYAHGIMTDAYILLEDPAGAGTNELSYPKFQTAGLRYVSMRYGVWDGSDYHADQLTFINLPVLKKHGMAGSTIAWKNLIGFVLANSDTAAWRYGNWDHMHDFFWGYTGGANRNYGLLGRQMALVRAPDLSVVDAIWVAVDDNTWGNALREDILLASTDPFAVDWYASEYVLRLLAAYGQQDSSAARAGLFRNATRVNQNAAAAVWPGGSYPWIDLLNDYDGDEPSDVERNQMNAYVAEIPTAVTIAEVDIHGPAVGQVGAPYTLTAVITPSIDGSFFLYAWSPEPEAGQGWAAARYRWAAPGDYTVTLAVVDWAGVHAASHLIAIQAGDRQRIRVYAPLVVRDSNDRARRQALLRPGAAGRRGPARGARLGNREVGPDP